MELKISVGGAKKKRLRGPHTGHGLDHPVLDNIN